MIFGFTQDPQEWLSHRLPSRLGIAPRSVDMGAAGHFYFHASCGDVAESEQAIALKLGFARSSAGCSLSAQQLLHQKIVQPHSIDSNAIRGNALVACFSKVEPRFSVYQTLMALPQLYYTRLEGGILCATQITSLLSLLDQVQLNEDAIPMHFLFRLVPGPMTYFQSIQRLFPGQALSWSDHGLDIRLVQDLRFPGDGATFNRVDSTSIEALHGRMRQVMGAYLGEAQPTGHSAATLLSGGVDSSLIQLLINEQPASSEPPPSYSFAVRVPSFEFEVGYARYASRLLQTRHTFVDISPQAYPDLLTRTIETLGQPDLYNESIPCNLALAEFLASGAPDVQIFFAGQAADALNGVSEARKVALFETANRFPGSHLAFRLASALLAAWSPSKADGLRHVAQMLADAHAAPQATNPAVTVPTDYVATGTTNLQIARRCFGERVVSKCFDYRRALEAEYRDSPSVLEKIHLIDLLTAGYDPAVAVAQLFSAFRRNLVQFYLDEDVIRTTLAFKPGVRFLQGLNTKPLQKQILARQSLAELTLKRKGGTSFNRDLYAWMKQGQLQDMVQAIDLPGFVSQSDLHDMARRPGPFLWNLLTFDIFQKRVLKEVHNEPFA